ncbi:MAG: asparagine synthase (glutamine-hydrolyzing) [Rhodospirillales bacterium]|nr:asparagine synthase (glutamine-hydrolyzing) [Rhodospirillales bacterium]MCB9965589.1 asparagine synthase (glutamine-hydrolyzing) [Rhodospirillales bacterium]MCB9979830.1 asparagine synthase (glutamine-hydrolyzing) [Rhodospirillales bacterium]
MCGITGLWAARPNKNHQLCLQNMTDALTHRGPDQTGLWQEETAGVFLGHRRLSIMDTSTDGLQPMTSASGRYTIVFNGEFYNFSDLKAELSPHNPVYRGHSDTEIFLHAVDYWGLETALQKTDGMFAFALWDNEEKILIMARDRFGKKPLYVGWAGNDFVLASELKAFHQHPQFSKHIKLGAQDLFLTYGYVPAPHTIFERVWQLLPGHVFWLKQEDLQQKEDLSEKFKPYWSPIERAEKSLHRKTLTAESDLPDELETVLKNAIRKRMIADVPLGAFLSGGIDSSLITALMQAEHSERIKTYSIGFQEDSFDEAPFARQIAAHLGTDHHELYVRPFDALNVIPDLPRIYDEPFSDISAIPTYLLAKFASNDVTVALSGDGGDEIMGGYTRHISAPSLFRLTRPLPKLLKKGLKKGIFSLNPEMANRLDRAIPFLEELQNKDLFLRLLALSSNRDHWVNFGSLTPIPLQEFLETPIAGLNFAELMMLGDTLHTLPNKFLVKVDRASMANALEVRSPFLDTALFEYAWSLPFSMKIKEHKGKWLLRQVLRKYVPSPLFERPKQGFNIPLALWLRRDLKGWAEDLLSDSELKNNNFNADKIRSAWKLHQDGQDRFTNKLWAVLQYQSWARQWL